jgi:DNA-binding NarL/FixJ family response regulator
MSQPAVQLPSMSFTGSNAASIDAKATPELEERFTYSGWHKRQCMIADLAMGGLSYRQIGQKYGKTENNVRQFAWYDK